MELVTNRIGVKADLYQRVLFLMGGGATRRYHTVPMISAPNIAAHSFRVAWFCYLLASSPSVQLLMAALAHDMAEQVWGDIPAPAKRLHGQRETINAAEKQTLLENLACFPLTSEEDVRVLKLADCAAGMLECVEERALGNKFVIQVFEKFAGYYEELGYKPRTTEALPDVAERIYVVLHQLWEQANGGS